MMRLRSRRLFEPEREGERAATASPALARFGRDVFRTYGIVVAFVILVVIVGWGNPAFLSSANIFNMLSQWAPAASSGLSVCR